MTRLLSFLKPNQTQQLSPEGHSLIVVIHYGSMAGLVGHFLFIFLFFWIHSPEMAAYNIVSCLIFLACLGMNRRGFTHPALLLGTAEVVIHAILAVLFLGWESGFHFYLISLVPIIFYSKIWSAPFKATLSGLLGCIYIALYLYTSQVAAWQPKELAVIHLIALVNIMTVFLLISLLAHLYRSAATHAEASLFQANQKLKILAHTDPLTKLLNRRNMINLISEEVVHYHHTGQSFALIMGDIDNFKLYNDKFGHEAGDAVLVKVADTLRSCVRKVDSVSRWGGEEFLILLPENTLQTALSSAERMREKIAAVRIQMGDIETGITMTFGISTFSGAMDATHCIHQADQAMFQGKRQGKNCIVFPAEEITAARDLISPNCADINSIQT